MPYTLNSARSKRKARKPLDIHQNSFPKGYVSTIDNSRRPQDSLSDMTNLELVQDNVVRPRPPLVRYGTQPTLPVVGRGNYRYQGKRGILWMLNDGGVGKIYRQLDGGPITLVGGSYDPTVWTMFQQSKGRIYPYNGKDKLSFPNLKTDTVTTYTKITASTAPSFTRSTNLTSGSLASHYYYRISFNNDVGESNASTATAVVSVNTPREGWNAEASIAKTVTLTWTKPIPTATTTIYVGTDPLNCKELISLGPDVTSYIDDGSLATNPYKLAPEGNSTDGFIPIWLYTDTKNSQLFGVAEGNKLYYSSPGSATTSADFSPYGGGGWVTIDEDGDTELNFVDGFRDGSGKPVITTSSRGAAGKGLLSHVTFEDLTVGDQIITYPNVYPASGQSDTYAPRATLKSRDSLTYFTGQDVRDTGTSQNIMNILTTNTVSQSIEPDIDKINLQALSNAVGVEYKDRQYFALPVGSSTNNEIWYRDLTRKGVWVQRWTVAARDLWLYEDNSGMTHFCALVGNKVLEFTRAGGQSHQDDGVAFRSRAAFEALNWDKDGITPGTIRNQYFKFLAPKGSIQANATGLTRTGVSMTAGSDSFEVTTTFTGIGQWDYSGAYKYGDDPGVVETFGKSVAILELRPKGLLNQVAWEVIGATAGTDYILSTVSTRGWYSEDLILKV